MREPSQQDDSRPGGRRAGGSDPARTFREQWTGSHDAATASAELLPVRLARACVIVLPVDGAGMSLHETQMRVPVGASDEFATLAERLQFTQGEGPCLESAASRRMVTADAGELEARWPSFAAELFLHTPFRAIVSLPLPITRTSFGALDLYLIDSAALGALNLRDVSAVSSEVVDALATAVAAVGAADPRDRTVPGGSADEDLVPVWLHSAPAQARTYVWVAMGMVMTQFRLSAADGLALLRSYAYGHDRLLDDIAADVVAGTISVAEMSPSP